MTAPGGPPTGAGNAPVEDPKKPHPIHPPTPESEEEKKAEE